MHISLDNLYCTATKRYHASYSPSKWFYNITWFLLLYHVMSGVGTPHVYTALYVCLLNKIQDIIMRHKIVLCDALHVTLKTN